MYRISRLRSGIVLGSKWVTRDLYENKMPIQEVADQIRGLHQHARPFGGGGHRRTDSNGSVNQSS